MIKSFITTVGAAALGLASLITPAQAAPGTGDFSALDGVQAQSLSAGEMDAIHGGAVSVAQANAAMAAAMSRLGSARGVLRSSNGSGGAVTLERQASFVPMWNRVVARLVARGVLVP